MIATTTPRTWGNTSGMPSLGIVTPVGGSGSTEDSYRTAALKALRARLNGPYTEDAQQSLINRQADMSAAAEAQQQEQLRNDAANSGINPTDPALMAETRRLAAERQAQNLGAAGDVRRRAVESNFSGGMAAARALLGSGLNTNSGFTSVGGHRGSGRSMFTTPAGYYDSRQYIKKPAGV